MIQRAVTRQLFAGRTHQLRAARGRAGLAPAGNTGPTTVLTHWANPGLVTAAAMAGVVWAIRNPDCGIVEPDDLPHDDILTLCRPYLGRVVGVHTDWTPLHGRDHLFEEDIDRDDPWQFGNFRVT